MFIKHCFPVIQPRLANFVLHVHVDMLFALLASSPADSPKLSLNVLLCHYPLPILASAVWLFSFHHCLC